MSKIAVSKIAELRIKAGLTQEELATQVGVSTTTIRNYEKDRTKTDWLERAIRLCKALNCKLEDLIEYVDPEETAIE